MDLTINPTDSLNGEIVAPSSKSYSHRAFIIASLADGISIIKNALNVGDVRVTIDILKSLKVKVLRETENTYIVQKTENSFKSIEKLIDCKNSGTSIRIFSALSLLVEGGVSLTGEFLKRNRPITPLLDALKDLGAEYELLDDILKISKKGDVRRTIKIKGDISSQFITALLILTSAIKCDELKFISIEITSPLVSYPYIQITLEVLKSFGVNVIEKLNDQKTGMYVVECGQTFRPQVYEVPGDFSSTAFILAAAVLAPKDSKVVINNLDIQNPQGDKKIIEILKEMGAEIIVNSSENQVIIDGNRTKNPLSGVDVDCNDIPDLFPILSVLGAFAKGKTTLYNASNLRSKESDRISVMARELTKMGVKVEEKNDKLTIFHSNLKGITIDHENDHRIAMACSIGALSADSSSTLKNIEIIQDSYPNFVEDLKKLGANIEKL